MAVPHGILVAVETPWEYGSWANPLPFDLNGGNEKLEN